MYRERDRFALKNVIAIITYCSQECLILENLCDSTILYNYFLCSDAVTLYLKRSTKQVITALGEIIKYVPYQIIRLNGDRYPLASCLCDEIFKI